MMKLRQRFARSKQHKSAHQKKKGKKDKGGQKPSKARSGLGHVFAGWDV